MKAQSFSSFGVDPHEGVRARSAKQFVVGETATLKYVKEIAFFPRPPKLRVSIAYCGLSSMLTLRPVKAVALPLALRSNYCFRCNYRYSQIPAAVSPRIESLANMQWRIHFYAFHFIQSAENSTHVLNSTFFVATKSSPSC